MVNVVGVSSLVVRVKLVTVGGWVGRTGPVAFFPPPPPPHVYKKIDKIITMEYLNLTF